VYNRLGYGFLEKVYSRALEIELRHRGLQVRREVKADIYYRSQFMCSQRIDLLVVEQVVVEVKAADSMPGIAIRQCRAYLKALALKVGLVLNFGEKPQIKRVIFRGEPMGGTVEVRLRPQGSPDPGPAHDAQG
jgi:GxxExxY protein